MAVAFVGQATGSSSTAATSGSVPIAAPAAGNVLVAIISLGCTTSQASVSSVASTGATWAQAAQSTFDTDTNAQCRVEIWTAAGDTGTSVTITFSDSCKWAANVSEWSGLSTTVAVPGVTVAAGLTAPGATQLSAPVLASVPAGALCLGGLVIAKDKGVNDMLPVSGSPDASTALTEAMSGATTAGNVHVQGQYAVTAGVDSETLTWTTGGGTTYHYMISAVALAAASTGVSNTQTLSSSLVQTPVLPLATGHGLTASVTEGATLGRAPAHGLAASLAASGVPVRVVARGLAALVTPGVALLRGAAPLLGAVLGVGAALVPLFPRLLPRHNGPAQQTTNAVYRL